MHIIEIAIRNKIAVNTHQKEYICGNDDFVVMFDFDAEWDAFVHKTARFISNGKHVDVVFSGNECQMPIHSGTNTIMCGVYAGDLRTTTPALIGARKSILCGSTAPAEPHPDVYAQMVALFNSGLDESRVNANRAENAKTAAEEAQRKAESAQSTSETIAKDVAQAKSDARAAQTAAAQSAKEAKEAASKAGSVKTVNGQSPDENGNIEVEGVTDYNKLKNRPFGSDGVQMVEIFPETTAEIDSEEGFAQFAATVQLVEGQPYTVKCNGVDYECVCLALPAEVTYYILGNTGPIIGGGDTGEPFLFISVPDEGACAFYALDGSASVTLSISGEAEVIDKMEAKFLPNGVPYVEPFDDVILETTVLADASTGYLTNQRRTYNLSLGSIVPGNIYNVVLDGVIYQTVARSLGIGVALGSGMVPGSDNVQPGMPYTEEPFCMVVYPSAIAQEYGLNVMIEWAGIVPETMSINGAFKVNKLNKWCLPDLVTPLIVTISPVPNSSPYQTADIPFEEAYAAVHCGRPVFARVDVRPDTHNTGTAIVTNMGTNTGVIWFDGYDVDSKLATWTWRKDSLTKTLKS